MHIHFFLSKEELTKYRNYEEALAVSEKYVEEYETFIIHANVHEREVIDIQLLTCEDEEQNEHFVHLYTIKKER